MDSVLPVRGYFLSVSGALLLLLLAADWVLPAPLPDRFALSNTALPPIRIRSDVKGPEPVVIDTNHPLPAIADQDRIAAGSQPGRLDAPDAAQDTGSPAPVDDSEGVTVAPLSPQVRDSMARSDADQAAHRPMYGKAESKLRNTSSHARRARQRPSVEHLRRWCDADNGRCSAAFLFARPSYD